MEEVKKEFIPLPDVEADPIGAEYVRSGSEPSDPLPSRMTREYSEFLHRFDDADPFETAPTANQKIHRPLISLWK